MQAKAPRPATLGDAPAHGPASAAATKAANKAANKGVGASALAPFATSAASAVPTWAVAAGAMEASRATRALPASDAVLLPHPVSAAVSATAVPAPSTAQPPLSLHEEVAQRLRELIYSGDLAPGGFVDEPALCERLAISRTPLREALKVLTAEGLTRHEPRRGCFVNQITERDLDDIFPVIALLEGRCAFEAAARLNDADVGVLELMHQRLRECAEAGQMASYYEANHVIHEAIIRLADNRWLAQVIADLRKILRLSRQQSLQAPGRMAQSLSEHLAVFAALKARDSTGAEAAMRTHLLRQREALRELTRQQPRSLLS